MAQMGVAGNQAAHAAVPTKVGSYPRQVAPGHARRAYSAQIDVKAVLAALQPLEQATDHLTVSGQVFLHPVGVARVDLRHVRPDLIPDGQQVLASGVERPAAAQRPRLAAAASDPSAASKAVA